MSAAFKYMTAEQIRTRLQEISEAERKHTARDMDAELANLMRGGGDVDAMEAAQLDAERATRRLRVERAALDAELPQAIRREGEVIISDLHRQHQELAAEAAVQADALCKTWAAFSAALNSWEHTQATAERLTKASSKTAEQSGAAAPRIGNFRSKKVAGLGGHTAFISERFISAAAELHVGFSVQSTVLD